MEEERQEVFQVKRMGLTLQNKVGKLVGGKGPAWQMVLTLPEEEREMWGSLKGPSKKSGLSWKVRDKKPSSPSMNLP